MEHWKETLSYLPHYIKPRGEDTLVLGGAAPHPR
jgi:hypothetical protein